MGINIFSVNLKKKIDKFEKEKTLNFLLYKFNMYFFFGEAFPCKILF